ncbi:MAG: hypothetical protein KDA85_20635, partial [Planctomycetaceae bacterium]|nr:hypothetical protein [Planctomycetaceae bacterium]
SHQLRVIPIPESHPDVGTDRSRQVLDSVLFLPFYPELTAAAVSRMAGVIRDVCNSDDACRSTRQNAGVVSHPVVR